MSSKQNVVLVHGLWMNSAAMMPLAWRLRRCGFRVARFSYRSVRAGIEENAAHLARFCADLRDQELSLVGHSLGGLTILTALSAHPDLRARRVVLLGVPFAGIGAAQHLSQSRLGRSLVGRTIHDWLHRPRPSLPAGVDLGVIAGDVSIGLGRIVVPLPGPNDGVVCVTETRVPGARESLVLHVNHSGMLVSAPVARATCDFLRKGTFGQGHG
jgi:pimeloyl-ACP methyl ester carboxylesterase